MSNNSQLVKCCFFCKETVEIKTNIETTLSFHITCLNKIHEFKEIPKELIPYNENIKKINIEFDLGLNNPFSYSEKEYEHYNTFNKCIYRNTNIRCSNNISKDSITSFFCGIHLLEEKDAKNYHIKFIKPFIEKDNLTVEEEKMKTLLESYSLPFLKLFSFVSFFHQEDCKTYPNFLVYKSKKNWINYLIYHFENFKTLKKEINKAKYILSLNNIQINLIMISKKYMYQACRDVMSFNKRDQIILSRISKDLMKLIKEANLNKRLIEEEKTNKKSLINFSLCMTKTNKIPKVIISYIFEFFYLT